LLNLLYYIFTIVNKEITLRIKTIIDYYELRVSSFADKIGVQRSSISHLLSGRNKPSLDFILKLISAYPEVDLYWLLNGKGKFPSEDRLNYPYPSDAAIKATDQKPPPKPNERESAINGSKSEPVKIVVFYANGTFESFDAKNK